MPSDAPQASKFYLTTPIYYVNARPHIGHAYTTIVADVLARRHRLQGDDTFFLTGTDEHGQKIERSAAAAGIPPQQFADEVSAQFRTLWDRMGLTYNAYIRTTDPSHKRGAQKLFADLYQRGAIYLSSYTGQYCVSEEIFVEGPPGTIGPDGKLTETVTEENFFFRLSQYQRDLLNLIETDTLRITPEARKNEVLSFLRGNVAEAQRTEDHVERPEVENVAPRSETAPQIGYSALGHPYVIGALRDLSVSRSSFTWGIPVPEAIQQAAGAKAQHVMYVWLDALTNYMTAIGYGDPSPEAQAKLHRYWAADLHIMAKEITRQHCIYWPAFLLAAGLPLPKAVTAHGWLLFDNSKMSKSKGNIVRTETILDAFGDHVYGKQFPDSTKQERDLFAADVLRYFLLREIPFGQDGSFSFDALVTRYNADLANGYGNLVSRTLNMILKYFNGVVPNFYLPPSQGGPPFSPQDTIEVRANAIIRGNQGLDHKPHFYLELLNVFIRDVDEALSRSAPWKERATEIETNDNRALMLYFAAEAIRILTAHLYAFIPETTAKVWAQLGLGDIEAAAQSGQLNNLQWGGLQPGTRLGPLSPIFPRADKSLTEVMLSMEEARNTPATPPVPEATPTSHASEASLPQAKAAESLAGEKMPTTREDKPSTDPGAAPRTASLDEPTGTLTVGGSNAETPTLPTTPGPHGQAPASGVFSATPQPAPSSDASSTITIDDFMKVDLRVAQVVTCDRIPKADKLLRLEVDLGPELGRRQILSGIAQHYTPEELLGRRIVVVSNLAPRKMRGLDSHGMLLAASEGPDGKPILATFAEEVPLGSRVR